MTRTSLRRTLRAVLATTFVAAGSLVGLTLSSAPASAAPAACDALYIADSASGDVHVLDPDSGAVGARLYDGSPAGATGTINQLGIGAGGAYAINTIGNQIVKWTAPPAGQSGPGTVRAFAHTAQTNAFTGAVNPANGLFYYGSFSTGSPMMLQIAAFDPATNSTLGQVASVPIPGAPGNNGDLAFAPDGTLYFVNSSNSVAALYRLTGRQLPTAGPAVTYPAAAVDELSRTSGLPGGTNGIAFAADGRLYLGRSREITRVNPITGQPVGSSITMSGLGNVSSLDLGSCAGPNTVRVDVQLPDGQQNPGDQFTGGLSGGSYGPDGPTTTTPAGGGGASSDPAIVLPGETYDVDVTPAPGNGPNPYTYNYECTDSVTGEVLEFGAGTSTDLTLPPGTGLSVDCVFTPEEPRPAIDLAKTVSPERFDSVGDGPLVYTFTVRNTGNTLLDDFALTDELEGLGPITCTPVAEGGSLPPKERVPGTVDQLRPGQTVCTARRPITQAEVESRQGIDNSADVDAAPPARFGLARAGSSDTVTAQNVVQQPAANDDVVGAQLNQTVTLPGATDDTAGTAAIDLAGTRLLGPEDQPVTELAVTGGTFTVVTTGDGVGTIRFVPDTGFAGTATAPYRIVDGNGFTSDATVRVTVQAGPTAKVDAAETDQNVDVLVPVLANDVPGLRADGSAGAFDPTTLSLVLTDGLPEGSELSDDGSTLTVPGEGTWTAIRTGPDAGQVRFDPEPGFTGPASPVTYVVEDQAGNRTGSRITVEVAAVTPVANGDGVKTPAGTPVTGLDVLDNDDEGAASAPLVPGSVVFTSDEATDDGKRLETVDGVWTIAPDGTVSFDPAPGFEGPTTVTYQVADANGTTATADVTVVVGQAPLAAPDSAGTPQNKPVTIDVLGNDVPGDQGTPCVPPDSTTPAGCDTGTFDVDSVVFPADAQPDGAEVSNGGKRLEVPGQGVWTVQPSGSVVFAQEPGFSGPADAVSYQVTDSYGNVASGTISVSVRAIVPSAANDTASTPFNTPVTGMTVIGNDKAGVDDNGTPDDESDDVSPPLVAGSVVFTSDEATDGGKRLETSDGVWTIAPNGTVSFAPAAGVSGPTTVAYRVADANGTTATAEVTVTVRPGPTAEVDPAETDQNVDVLVPVLGNDVPGLRADGSAGAFDPTTLILVLTDELPEGSRLSDDGVTLTVPGEGRWTAIRIGPDVGQVRFDPEPGFTGPASPVTYVVEDQAGNPTGSRIEVEVAAVTPTAADDAASTPYATPVTGIDVLENDEQGAASAPLVAGSVVFTSDEATAGGKRLETADGVWTIAPNGTVSFAPAAGVSGPTTVTYRVADANGTTATAEVTVTVAAGPTADEDTASTPQNRQVTLDPLVNDTAGVDPETGESGVWRPATLALTTDGFADGDAELVDGRLVVRGQGAWSVDAGRIVFTPERGFTGAADPVTYVVEDEFGNPASSTVTVTVRGIAPTATDDSARTPFATRVKLQGATDDRPGVDDNGTPDDPSDDVRPALQPGLTVFPSPGQPDDAVVSEAGKKLVVGREGTYVIGADGSVEFKPEPGFTGPTTPVTYRIEDANGTTDLATLTVTVAAGPTASDDTASTPQNRWVELTPSGNDVAGTVPADGPHTEWVTGTWRVGSLRLTEVGQPAGSTRTADGLSLTVPGEGTYVVDPVTGKVRFTPEPQFTGQTTPVRYRALDEFGNPVTAEIRIEVGAVVPVARDDRGRTPYRTPVVLDVLDNDRAGSADAALDASTVRLVDPVTGERVRRLVVQGEGTWTVTRDGDLRFAPTRDFTGRTTPVDYIVLDANGSQAGASATVLVDGPGEALPTSVTTSPGTPVRVDVLDNVTPAPGTDLVPGSVCVLPATITVDGEPRDAEPVGVGGDPSRCVDSFTLPGVGSWTVEPDGSITFDPAPGFTGTATIDFAVDDTRGDTYTTTLTVDVTDSAVAPGAGAPPAGGSSAGPGGVLPNTGGPALWALLAGLALLAAGGTAVRRSRRRA